jgi:hypothetical protein
VFDREVEIDAYGGVLIGAARDPPPGKSWQQIKGSFHIRVRSHFAAELQAPFGEEFLDGAVSQREAQI